MKVLIDTNVLISAALNAKSTSSLAYVKAAISPNRGMICEQTIRELKDVFRKKFPGKLSALERFLSSALPALDLVDTPKEERPEETSVRDAADRPILRAALAANADILLTGDKDFLESGITHPIVMTPSQFLLMP